MKWICRVILFFIMELFVLAFIMEGEGQMTIEDGILTLACINIAVAIGFFILEKADL
jgi:uncharacterized protein involved in tellurium resistance